MSYIPSGNKCLRCRLKCVPSDSETLDDVCVLIPERNSELFLINLFNQMEKDGRKPAFGWKSYLITGYERREDDKGRYHSEFELSRVAGSWGNGQ